MFRKNKLAMIVGEFLGTGLLTLVVLSVKNSQIGLPYFVAAAAGLIVVLLTLALAGISGAVFNPAMTIGLWTVRKIKTLQALFYLVVQFAGAAAAWLLFRYLLDIHTTVPNTSNYTTRLLVAEAIGAFIFAFIWAAAIYQRFGLYAKAVAIGGGLTIGVMAVSIVTGAGILNPAVAVGTRAFGWATVLGPIIGAVVGFNLYNLLFVKTELAEIAESKSEKSKTTKVNQSLTFSEVANEVEAADKNIDSKTKVASVRKNIAKNTTSKKAAPAKKPVAKKAPAKKPVAKKRNPNAV